MTNKAYIVANKEQEIDILSKLELDGIYWNAGEYPTDFIPSEEYDLKFVKFPYALVEDKSIYWLSIDKLKDIEIVYDGRKGVKMTKKYKVTQEFMDALDDWRDKWVDGHFPVNALTSETVKNVVERWRLRYIENGEPTKRLGALLNWINGEDVFEVEVPHKFVVRSDKKDRGGDYAYVSIENGLTTASYFFASATKFDTREEAQEWANSHQVVVAIDEKGNEVE